jgi:hypothetical protein
VVEAKLDQRWSPAQDRRSLARIKNRTSYGRASVLSSSESNRSNPIRSPIQEILMKVKLFTTSKKHFETLEANVNAWLADHPGVEIKYAHRLSQPTFGWGHLAVAVWYTET